MHVGDWNSYDSEYIWDAQWFNRSYPNNLEAMQRLPYMGCRGNHEESAIRFKKYWPYAGSDCYYSFDYGPVHVVVIDLYVDFTPGSTQYDRIVNDLSSSTKPFIVPLYHVPAWSANDYAPTQRMLDTRNYLVPLFQTYNVKLIVNGHNHFYARAFVDGISHLTTGGGGAPLTTPDFSQPYVVAAESSFHFCRFDVAGNTMTVSAIRLDGSIIERFIVPGSGPEPSALDDNYSTLTGTELNVAAPGVLANDLDPQDDPLTAVLNTDVSHGTLVLNSDGSFDYTPDAGFIGIDTFTYHASDSVFDSHVVNVTIDVTDWVSLACDGFESGWGNYTDGGDNASIEPYPFAGSYCAVIQDGTASSNITLTDPMDMTGYDQIKIDFWYKGYGMEPGEDYLLEYYDGSVWQVIHDYISGVDFEHNVWNHDIQIVDRSQYTFPTDMKVRFRCNASDNTDNIDLDEICISARIDIASPTSTPMETQTATPTSGTPTPGYVSIPATGPFGLTVLIIILSGILGIGSSGRKNRSRNRTSS